MITAECGKRKWSIAELQADYQTATSLVPYRERARSVLGQFYHRIFTPAVTLWCLVFQRLNADHTCEAVVSHIKSGGMDLFEAKGEKEPLSRRLKSESTASYCQARSRLPLSLVWQALLHTSEVVEAEDGEEKLWQGRRVFLLDGTTLLLRPEPALKAHFGIHRTQKKESYWVMLRVVVAFSMRTAVVRCAANGTESESEQRLAKGILAQARSGEVYVGDRNFGIFSVVQAARHYAADVVLRLTRPRAAKLYPKQLYPGCDHQVTWGPSSKDTLVDTTMSCKPVTGRLIYVRLERPGYRSQDLYLFTTLLDPQVFSRQALVQLYGERWHVELNLRYVKAELDMHLLTAKSVDMVQKELFAGLIAYNLIRGFMVQAARSAGCSPLTLSFTKCWRRVRDTLLHLSQMPEQCAQALNNLTHSLANCRLTHRRRSDPEPRQKHYPPKTYPELRVSREEAKRRLRRRRLAEAVC